MTLLGGPFGQGPKSGPAQSAIPYITEKEFEAQVLRSELPVLVEFTASWSAPNRQIAQEVEAFAGEMAGKVTMLRVDVDQSKFLATQLRIKSLPAFMLFVGGRVGDAQMGAIGRKEMRAMVEPFLPRQPGALKPIELSELLKQKAVTPVDTRDAAAYSRAHLPNAISIPLDEIPNRIAELYMQGGPPVLYCRSGEKSKELVAAMAEQNVELGFLEGGLLAWESEGFPIERG